MPFDDSGNRERVEILRHRGVDIWGPERVYVGEDVDLAAIAPGAEIRQATLRGPTVAIGAGSVIGTSGHAEVQDCQIGRDVELGAGWYSGATLLEGVRVRGFAEIRPGTLLEEQADLAHCVALKNTTFTCCCVAGSMINYCDLFLTGGTSRKDHTEIGSGAVHYNFDPRGDKWGSLIGSIRGVLMQSAPVFVGGTSGLIGPRRIGLGAVVAAGSIVRRDVAENELSSQIGGTLSRKGFDRFRYGPLKRQFMTTARLVRTLNALDAWYRLVRTPHARDDEKPLLEAARGQIKIQIKERIARLGKVIAKLAEGASPGDPVASGSPFAAEHLGLISNWEEFRRVIAAPCDSEEPPQEFVSPYASARARGSGHLDALVAAGPHAGPAEEWLEGLVERTASLARKSLLSR